MSAITRILIAAVRANPTLAAAIAFDIGILLTRAIRQRAGNNPVGRSAQSLERTLAAYKPSSPRARTATRSRRRRRAA